MVPAGLRTRVSVLLPAAVALFLQELRARLGPGSIGAFTFADNVASRRVLEKSGFALVEAFEEDGVPSLYLQREL